jgi:hypothetical protein
MARFTIEQETDKLAWCVHDTTDTVAGRPALPYLELDVQRGTLQVQLQYAANRGVSMSLHYGFDRRWSLSPTTNAVRLTRDINAGEFDAPLSDIVDGAEVIWDGHNHRCCLSPSGEEACDEVAELLAAYMPDDDDCGGLWEAATWLQHTPPEELGLTAHTTDEELAAIAAAEQAYARTVGSVLYDLEEYLQELREELREQRS